MIGLLLFFDSFYNQTAFSETENEILVVVFEVLPFLVGLVLLVIGAEHIRRTYAKQKNT